MHIRELQFNCSITYSNTMESKLFILVVLASLSQSSYVPTLKIYYGLSEKQVAVLNENLANQYAAGTAYDNGVESLFKVFFNLDAKADEDCSKVSEAIIGMKAAVDLSFDSVLIIVGKSCSTVEVARKASYDYLHNAAAEAGAAFKLAQSGNYCKNRDAIEVHRTAAQEDFKKLVETFYNLISTRLNTKNGDVLSVIENAQNGSYLGFFHMNNAVFNAIEVWAAAVGHADKNFISDMEDFEDKALSGMKEDVLYKFSTVPTFYINAQLNKKRILSRLAANQYALSRSAEGYKDGNRIVFGAITRYLQRIYLGLNDDGELAFSRDDADSGAALANFDAADSSNLASIRLLRPNSSAKIAAIQEKLFNANALGTAAYFDSIHAAANRSGNYSEVIDDIKTLRNNVNTLGSGFTENYFIIIRDGQSFDEKQEAELETLMEESIEQTLVGVNRFLDAVVILANATHTGKVSQKDFSQILQLRDASDKGNTELAQGISAACLLVLISSND